MRVTEPQLRAVRLAQTIEEVETGRTLVSQADWDDATRSAVAAAHQRGVLRVDAGDVLLDRAHTIAQRASGRDATVSALREPAVQWRWLARGLPLLALLMGLAVDRIANSQLDEVVITNPLPPSDAARACKKIRQLSVAFLFAETIRRISDGESVTSLFAEQNNNF